MTGAGGLRTYLGTAPGVGKTYAMLSEGQRRADGGDRVVIGWVEQRGRPETRAQFRGLQIARARGAHRVVVARHRTRLGELVRGSVALRLGRLLPDMTIDVVRPEG